MSDNKNISIQDRGWDQMRTVLDKELPEKKRKRKIVPFFIFGTFIIALLVFLRLSIFTDYSDDLNPTVLSSQDNQYASTMVSEELDNQGKNEIDQKDNPEDQLKSTFDQSTFQNITSNSNETNLDGVIQVSKTNKKGTKEGLNQSIDHSKRTVILDEGSNMQHKGQKILSYINSKSGKDLKESQLNTLNINGLDSNYDYVNNRISGGEERPTQDPLIQLPTFFPFLKLPVQEIKRKEIRPITNTRNKGIFSPYLFAMTNYQSSNKSLGYRLGAGLDYQLNDWSAYLELGYFWAKYNMGEDNADFVDVGTVAEVEGDNGNSGSVTGISKFESLNIGNFSNLTSSTSEINFNLGIRRKISDHINIDLGIAYSRLIYASNKSFVVNFQRENSMNEIISVNIGSSELYDAGVYSSYDIMPHIGIEYNFMPGLFFGLNYNYGLKNLIAQTNVEQFNSLAKDESIFRRNIEGKLRYQF